MTELTKKVLDSIVSRLKKGTSTLGKESKALGINRNGPLREALRQHLGSKKAYDELIAKAWEKRPRTKATGTKTTKNKKASKAKTPKKTKNPSSDDGSKDSDDNGAGNKTAEKKPSPDEGSSSDEDGDSSGDGEPQDVVEAMSSRQEEDRREDFVQNGVAGVEEQAMSLV